MAASHFLVVFDGTCNFCNRSVRFIMKRDKRERFKFLSSGTPEGQALAARHGFGGPAPGSILLIDGEEVYSLSTASLEIARRLDGLWPAVYALVIIPRPLRDGLYKWFAARRHKFFGKTDQCEILPDSRRGGGA